LKDVNTLALFVNRIKRGSYGEKINRTVPEQEGAWTGKGSAENIVILGVQTSLGGLGAKFFNFWKRSNSMQGLKDRNYQGRNCSNGSEKNSGNDASNRKTGCL